MPCFVIAQASARTGQTSDAVLCVPNPRTDVSVQIKGVLEHVLSVYDEPRGIILCTGENGTKTYLIDGSTKRVRNRERRAAAVQALAQLGKLRDCLAPLKDESKTPQLATEGLALLFNWIAEERERLTVRSMSERQQAHQTTAEMQI
jgi:hypothetical protein